MADNKSILYGLAVLLIIILTIVFYPTPATGNHTTDTLSSSFNNKEEKINFLKSYINLPTEIKDSEYHLIYFSGSGIGVGPSEWDFKILVKIAPENLAKWLENIKESTEEFDLSWAKELLPDNWQISSGPKYYLRSGELTVFEDEAIIFWRLNTLGQ